MLKLNLSAILLSPRDLLTLRLGKYLRTHLVLRATTLHLEMLPLINSALFLPWSSDPLPRQSTFAPFRPIYKSWCSWFTKRFLVTRNNKHNIYHFHSYCDINLIAALHSVCAHLCIHKIHDLIWWAKIPTSLESASTIGGCARRSLRTDCSTKRTVLSKTPQRFIVL